MRFFRLKMPTCPKCGSTETKVDIKDCSNLVRIPAAVGSGTMIGVPIAAIAFVCTKCDAHFTDWGYQ